MASVSNPVVNTDSANRHRWITVALSAAVSVIMSGVVAPLVVQHFEHEHERSSEIRRAKMEVLRKIAGNEEAFEVADLEASARLDEGLNEARVVFANSPRVIERMDALWNAMDSNREARARGGQPKSIAKEFSMMSEAMCEDPDVEIDASKFDSNYFLHYFAPQSK